MAPILRCAGLEDEMLQNARRDATLSTELRFGRSVSIEQAGRLLHVSRRTVYYRIREGRLRTIRTIGGSQRVLVESLYENGFVPRAFSGSASAATLPDRSIPA